MKAEYSCKVFEKHVFALSTWFTKCRLMHNILIHNTKSVVLKTLSNKWLFNFSEHISLPPKYFLIIFVFEGNDLDILTSLDFVLIQNITTLTKVEAFTVNRRHQCV